MKSDSNLETPNSRLTPIREENRNLRYLRFLVDLALAEIRAGSFTLPQAYRSGFLLYSFPRPR